jgi:hypothetical protein
MSEPTYSLVYDRGSAAEVFKQVGEREIILAVLAGLAPEPDWDGCLVYSGDPPEEHAAQVCIGITGAAADRVQQWIVEGLERQGIVVLQVYEGGPEPLQKLTVASGGKWTTLPT